MLYRSADKSIGGLVEKTGFADCGTSATSDVAITVGTMTGSANPVEPEFPSLGVSPGCRLIINFCGYVR